LHVIEKTDIFSVPKGTTINDVVTEKDGWFLSDEYVEEVMRARIGK
jgi:hypothetical protein